ncbi:TonB-dependent receptor [Phocaeicola coprocola]|uniref:TonB-dependent receptor n=1 Tax=Phocaeicola coprocola TaxID=310298 RepID=UPI0026731570|nr:TonB-dependent receptor [Phocaeicola coprocola]
MNKTGLLIMSLALLGNSMQAQNKLYGTVENNGKPLPYVTVRLLETDSTFVSGVTTDTLGKYVFSNIEKGNYLVALSSIGYKPAFIQIKMSDKNLEVPLVTLETENVVLGEVVVKGSSFIRKDDHVLVIPDKQQVKHASTGYDLLYNLMIPNIEVNKRTGTVSTFGGEVSLYINGEKADYRDVQSLRPRDIENVEYYDVPTGKYANDVAAINYIVKKRQSGGYIFADGKQTIGYMAGDYNIGGKVAHDNTSYSFWGGHTMQKYKGSIVDKNETILFPDYTVYRNRETTAGNYRNNQQYMQFKVSNVNKKRNLSAQIALVRNETPSDENYGLLDYSGHYTYSTRSTDSKQEQNLSPSLRLFGDFNIGKNQTLEFTAKGSYTQNDYTRQYTENENNSLSDVKEDLYSFNFSANYNIKLQHQNSFGVDIRHYHNITSSTYAGDYSSWQHLWTGESMFMLNYSQRFGKHFTMILRPGLSWMNYKLHTEDVRRYCSLKTSSRFSYQFNKKQQLTLAADAGVNQPDISYMNNVDQTVDFLQIKRGNPFLDDMQLYNISLLYNGVFGKLNVVGGPGYSIYTHNVSPIYYLEGDKLIGSYRSDGNIYGLGIILNISYHVTDNLRTKLAFKYLNVQTRKNYNINLDSYSAILDINYFLKDFSINLFGKIPTEKIETTTLIVTKSPATYGASVSWSHKGWYIEAGTENPFTRHSRYREHADYGVYQYNQVQTSRIYQRTGYVKLAYTFDFGRKTSRDKNDVDRSINSAIMKAN